MRQIAFLTEHSINNVKCLVIRSFINHKLIHTFIPVVYEHIIRPLLHFNGPLTTSSNFESLNLLLYNYELLKNHIQVCGLHIYHQV